MIKWDHIWWYYIIWTNCIVYIQIENGFKWQAMGNFNLHMV